MTHSVMMAAADLAPVSATRQFSALRVGGQDLAMGAKTEGDAPSNRPPSVAVALTST